MLIEIKPLDDGLAVLSVSGNLTRVSAVQELETTLKELEIDGRTGILLDLSQMQRLNMSGLAALVELAARHPKTDLGFCGLPQKHLEFLRKSGLDRGLMIFETVEDACTDPRFKPHVLTKTRAVLLCAGKGSRVAPLTNILPKPMLDVAGKPAMHRIIDHIGSFGLRDVLLNPGHLGPQIVSYFRNTPMNGTNISFMNEGHWANEKWQSNPIGSASTLKRMQDTTAAFGSDVVVLCGDALIDIDLAQMMREHRASGAAVTIAAMPVSQEDVHKYGIIETTADRSVTRFVEKPAPGVTQSRLANTGIYIFKPDVFSLLSNEEGLDIACDLLPTIMETESKIHVFDAPFSWVDIGCGRDFVQAVTRCLKGELPFASPEGEEIRPGVWAMPGASVSRRAQINGPCHIGAYARVEAGAKLDGLCVVGAGAVVQAGALLVDSVVMGGTCVRSGVWADKMILHSDWAIDHTHADGATQRQEHLDCVPSFTSQLRQVA